MKEKNKQLIKRFHIHTKKKAWKDKIAWKKIFLRPQKLEAKF